MDDLISRAAAIEYLMTNMGWRDEDGYEVDDADEKRAIITDLLNGVSTIDAIPVEWLREKMNMADDDGDLDSVDLISWLIQTWQEEQETRNEPKV